MNHPNLSGMMEHLRFSIHIEKTIRSDVLSNFPFKVYFPAIESIHITHSFQQCNRSVKILVNTDDKEI